MVGISDSISVDTIVGTVVELPIESETTEGSSDGISVDTVVGISVEISVVSLEGIDDIPLGVGEARRDAAAFGSTQ